MDAITVTLVTKIIVTAVLLVPPFLLYSKDKLGPRLDVVANSPTFFRLYGVAMLALLAAYISGLLQVIQGEFPWGIIPMAIVSNGGGAIVLFTLGSATVKRTTAPVFGALAVAFIFCALVPDAAMTKFF
ncbi:hypothetical protein NBRC116601_04060 [Cognatishimia sp. WU-CL00825]|uniref:hypothetical protein n=1 Tax=Cognatishimia sp. WU-CL00825 TaxID=3127658 RepID=UPI003108E563